MIVKLESEGLARLDGISIAMLGIDGCGKSTLAKSLTASLQERNFTVVSPTWRSMVTGESNDEYPQSTIKSLVIEGWRLMFSSSVDRMAYSALPALIDDAEVESVFQNLPSVAGTPRQTALVVSALIGLAGDHLIEGEYRSAACKNGAISISDGFGIRDFVKMILMAKRISDCQIDDASLDVLIEAAIAMYGANFIQPDIGFHLDADPALTFEWLIADRGKVGLSEDLNLVGGNSGLDSYMEFQNELAAVNRRVAKSWGWKCLTVDGRSQEHTVAEALRQVLAHPWVDRYSRFDGDEI